MVEQTFRSPGFFEREIDLAARRQTVSGVPGGVIGTSLKGPAFVPVTVGDFTDFVNRFGTLDPDRPAVYAAYEFLKNKRALTFMRVLGAGGNITAADRDATRTQGVVKGAGFRVQGLQSTVNVKRIAANEVETFSTTPVLEGGVFFISAKHKLDVASKSQWAAYNYPILQDNPSVISNGYASMLRGVCFTATGYRMTAMPTTSAYTFASADPAGDDASASVKFKADSATAICTAQPNERITLVSEDNTSRVYVITDSLSSDADGVGGNVAVLSNGDAITAATSYVGRTHNKFVDKLIYANIDANDVITVALSAANGGDGTSLTIKFVDGAPAAGEADQIQIKRTEGDNSTKSSEAAILQRLSDALNGVNANAASHAFGNGVGAQNHQFIQQGIEAVAGDTAGKYTIRMRKRTAVNGAFTISNEGDCTISDDAVNVTAGTPITALAGANQVAVVVDFSTVATTNTTLATALDAAIAAAAGHQDAKLLASAAAGTVTVTSAVKGTSSNGKAATENVTGWQMFQSDESTVTTTFTGGAGDAAVMLQTDGYVTLLDAASAIASQEFNLVIVGDGTTPMSVAKNQIVHRTIKCSLDPEHPSYISKVLNTDPHKFTTDKHLLYLDLPVEDELAPVSHVLVSPPSDMSIADSAFAGGYKKAWSVMGRYDTRYTTAKSPAVISQPFGTQEFDLFNFESLSDGAAGNNEVKISIANIKASLDEANPWGTFEVVVRRFRDLDSEPEILEAYPGCTLDPNSENFIARQIGDYKTYYNFDADLEEERRLIVKGKYPNRSLYVRVRMSDIYERGEVPISAIPFGFRGIPVLKSSESLTDSAVIALSGSGAMIGNAAAQTSSEASPQNHLAASLEPGNQTRVNTAMLVDYDQRVDAKLASPIFPPFPLRYKLTRGVMPTSDVIPSGNPSMTEKVDSSLYWGMKSERLPRTGSIANSVLNPNAGGIFNELISGYTKFQGMIESGALMTGSAVDHFSANKFTLAKVALNKSSTASNIAEHITGSARDHMLEAVYLRNSEVDGSNYTVVDPMGGDSRVTMATLLSSSSIKFNRFTAYNKFTLPLFGGYDGLNILDKDLHLMNDRAASADAPANFFGKSSPEFNIASNFASYTGLREGAPGKGQKSSTVISFQQASRIMTDPMTVRHNILAIPGIRDSFVTDFAAEKVKEYSLGLYLMDIPAFSEESGYRLFGTEDRSDFSKLRKSSPDVRETAEQFSSRVVDNNYSAAYFPDVVIEDEINSTQVKVPASVAAMKALSFSDSVSFPWFAPAGFNRGALDNVTNVDVRLTAGDRDELYDARINPIANFPDGGIVIFGQKTLQLAKSALDRVNVRRMLLEIKRLISGVAERLLFEPNNPETRARFINLVTPLLATVQAQAGIDSFRIVMDDTNNTSEDVENNRLNGRIVVVPTRAIEFIAIDFIITNSGVSFE